MPSNYTQNFQLNQWAATDQVKRTDFNADNAKIDAALKTQADTLSAAAATIPKITMGTYAGNGTYGADNPVTLTFPFEPKLVIVTSGHSSGYFLRGGYGICNWQGNGCSNWALATIWNGCTLSWYIDHQYDPDMQLNTQNSTYTYLAIG